MSLFYPLFYKNAITAITVEELTALGARGLLLDIDNTLTRHRSQEIGEDVRAWLARMKAAGFAMTLVSNSTPRRVKPYADKLGLSCSYFSCKPLPLGYWRGVRRMKLKRKECVAIGDQVFTDVVGAKLAGVKCIQVMPVEMETGKPFLGFKRKLEARIIRKKREKLQR
ncbi:MAG: YqeG family HAD IIIA-type phosphatase [Oscillospiraceae bacterium]|nr:YqeG family HAD IIIA-type phosphatase [Oscillospiraceae bacterium]